MKKIHSELLLVFIIALWGLSFSLTKPLLYKVGVFNFLAYRFVIGGFLLAFILIITKKFKVTKPLLKSGITSGVLLFLAFYCHIAGLKYTTIAKNSFIVGSSVIFIPIILLLVHKKKSDMQVILQTILAVIGLGLITLVSSSGAFNMGDFITLIGTVLYAFYTIVVEKSVRKYSTNVFTTIQLSTVGILSLIATLLFEEITFTFTVSEWFSIGFLSIVLTGIAYYILNSIQKKLSASNVTLIFTLEPFFATLFGWLFLKESVGPNILIGGGLIIFSMMLPYISQFMSVKKVGDGYDF